MTDHKTTPTDLAARRAAIQADLQAQTRTPTAAPLSKRQRAALERQPVAKPAADDPAPAAAKAAQKKD